MYIQCNHVSLDFLRSQAKKASVQCFENKSICLGGVHKDLLDHLPNGSTWFGFFF